MAAYYNEHDPKAAAWLRELIKEGVIAPGEVDERSIEDVIPTELARYSQCHFFAGIGVWSHALRQAGWPDDRQVWTGSCPCQPFSAAGKGEGFTDERHLWPSWFHLIEQCRPRTIFGEQVSSSDGLTWFDLVSSDLEGALYTVGAADICAAGVGAPHIRQRLYFMAESERQREWRETGNGLGAETTNERSGSRIRANETRNGGPNDELADPNGRRSQAGRSKSPSADRNGRNADVRPEAAEFCSFGLMALSDGGDPGAEREQQGGEHRQQPKDGGIDELGDAESNGREQGRAESERIERGFDATERGEFNGMGDAERNGHDRPQGESSEQSGNRSEGRVSDGANLTNGFWRDAEWLYCRDGKYRPTKPGIFPLVNGMPGRVALLRGAGNAIVSEAAKEWIATYMDERKLFP